MNDYLTIKQTVDYIKRTDNTIRRVLIQKRNKINKNECFEVVKRIGNLYYIYKPYLDKRYNIKHTDNNNNNEINKTDSDNLEELRELRETIKMYSIMLEAKDNEIRGIKEEKDYFKNQNKMINKSLDKVLNSLEYAQKLNALDKKIIFKNP